MNKKLKKNSFSTYTFSVSKHCPLYLVCYAFCGAFSRFYLYVMLCNVVRFICTILLPSGVINDDDDGDN